MEFCSLNRETILLPYAEPVAVVDAADALPCKVRQVLDVSAGGQPRRK